METVGIGVGALGEINTWSFFTDPVWNTTALEGIFLRPLAESALDGPYQVHKYFIDRAMNYARCFTGDTAIMLADGQPKAIRDIKVGDVIMSFDPSADSGRGALVPKRVKRLFRNTTTEWIKLTWLEDGEQKKLVATPGHHMLDKTGAFTRLELMVHKGKAELVLASGAVIEAKAERITYSAETAHLFEQASSQARSAANASMKLMN